MYQKSTKAGSQSGIDRLNGNGEVSQLKDTEKDISRKSEVFSHKYTTCVLVLLRLMRFETKFS